MEAVPTRDTRIHPAPPPVTLLPQVLDQHAPFAVPSGLGDRLMGFSF